MGESDTRGMFTGQAGDKSKRTLPPSDLSHKEKNGFSSDSHDDKSAPSVAGFTGTVGAKIGSLVDTIRESVPAEGALGSAATAVAERFEKASSYVENYDYKKSLRDVGNIIRRNPIPTVLVGLGIGYLISRAFRRD